METTHTFDERLETLRDGLRQAAIHSPSSRTRWACNAALEAPTQMALIRVTRSLSCTYAPRLRRLIQDFEGNRHG